MIDQELKKKIVNTISGYELKFDKMKVEIKALKNAINQLVIKPMEEHAEKEGPLAQFRNQLDADFDSAALEKKVNQLASFYMRLQSKEAENKKIVSGLIKQGADSVGRLANKAHDKKAVSKLMRIIDAEEENHKILVNFNEVLSQCVSSILKSLEEIEENSKEPDGPVEVCLKVNDSLLQLLNHLAIPKDLDFKKEQIKVVLDKKLDGESLSNTIDGLTELVVDAFNMEQNRFKGFLQQLTTQLYDFDIYLKSSSDSRKQSTNESIQLEFGIQDNINQIRSHLDNSKSIEELSSKIIQNLDSIGTRIKEYRTNEVKRDKVYEKQVKELKEKLAESEQSAEEIKNLLSFQKYKVNHDSLTGLPNREAYDEHILEAFQRWKRSGKEISLAVADIDHFKKINDTFGHLAGDKVLKKVASIFKSSIRNVDIIARIGGEEFVFIFEQTTSKTAAAIIEKLRKAVQECQFYYRDNKVDVTVSFGLTSIKTVDDIESLFMRADKAMYQAKHDGRNRVVIL